MLVCRNIQRQWLVRLDRNSKQWRPPDPTGRNSLLLLLSFNARVVSEGREAHLLRSGSTGRENATRSPVPRSIRCRRAGTRTCLPTAPSAAAPAGRGRDRDRDWDREGSTASAAGAMASSRGHFARQRARSGAPSSGEKTQRINENIQMMQTSHL